MDRLHLPVFIKCFFGHEYRDHAAKDCPTGKSEFDPDGFTADIAFGPSGGTTTYYHGITCERAKKCLKCGVPR